MDNFEKLYVSKPFGPSIGEFFVKEEFVNDLNEYCKIVLNEKGRAEKLDVGKELAGQVKQEFQLPKSLGRSRQGEPVRTRQRTASMNLRLSRPIAPGSPTCPGNRGHICSQRSSEITKRSSSIQTSILQA